MALFSAAANPGHGMQESCLSLCGCLPGCASCTPRRANVWMWWAHCRHRACNTGICACVQAGRGDSLSIASCFSLKLGDNGDIKTPFWTSSPANPDPTTPTTLFPLQSTLGYNPPLTHNETIGAFGGFDSTTTLAVKRFPCSCERAFDPYSTPTNLTYYSRTVTGNSQ